MTCSACRLWLTQRVTQYEDGSVITNYQSPEGKGSCGYLKIETDSDFHCNHFEEGVEHIEVMGKKSGSPWHHSQWGVCPECQGVGLINDGACRRCARTGRVLYYDDGYIGEEQTRRHPNEATIGAPPVPTCPGCAKGIDLTWVNCPWCGTRIAPDEPVRAEVFVP